MQDCELLSEDLEQLVKSYKAVVQLELGEEFPNDPKAQLWGAVGAVFNSWMNQRAKTYRCLVLERDHTRWFNRFIMDVPSLVRKHSWCLTWTFS